MPKYVISEASLEAVYNCLFKRIQHYHSSHAGLQLTPKYTAHEIALLCSELEKPETAILVDPSSDMMQTLNRFLDWLVMDRQIKVPVADVPELHRLVLDEGSCNVYYPRNLAKNRQSLAISPRHTLLTTLELGIIWKSSWRTVLQHTPRHKFLGQDTSQM